MNKIPERIMSNSKSPPFNLYSDTLNHIKLVGAVSGMSMESNWTTANIKF